jgi:hypothetical protein
MWKSGAAINAYFVRLKNFGSIGENETGNLKF